MKFSSTRLTVPPTRGLLVALMLGATASQGFADTYPRQPGVDAVHYAFRLTLRDDTDEIAGEATAELRFTKSGVTEAALDLASPAQGKGMTVSAVTFDGKPVAHTHERDRLRITLDPPPKEGDRRRFTVTYSGVPARGLRIGLNKFQERTFFSLNWPDLARQWLPIIDHPSDKATSEFLITAPGKYQVVSNGLLQEERDLGDGRRLTHWKQSVPIASWLNAIGVAQFSVHHAGLVRGIPLQTWVYHQERDAGIITFEEASKKAIAFYSDYVGPYPYEKLANVVAAGLGGGTEHASAIFYGEPTVRLQPATGLVAHEIAHQWFGNSVTESDWDDVWLSEGFATYFTLLCTEHYEGRDAFVRGLKSSRDRVIRTAQQNPAMRVLHEDLADTRRVLNQLVYQKGGWTLHMLRGQVGSDKFQSGIRGYYRKYRDGNATTDDFRRVMEEHSGQELAWFFDQWLRRPGSPLVEGSWRYDPVGKRVEIELAQTQQGRPYRLPLEVGISGDSPAAERTVRIELTQAKQTFEIPADKEPTTVVLDPNTWVLMQAKFEKR